MQRRVRGFTLVELLVVIAIIGVMVGLLLPAVQAAREAARRMSCTNNLKQIGLALHNYHDTHKKLPPGWLHRNPSGVTGSANYGWAVNILPFMEMGSLYEELNPGPLPLYTRYKASPDADSQRLLQTSIPGYRCPSDVTPELNTQVNFGPTNHFRVATANYVGSAGNGVAENLNDPGGVFFGNSFMGFQYILDGLSNTLAVAERDGGPSATGNSGDRYRAAVWPGAGRNYGTGPESTARTVFRANFIANHDYAAAGQPQNMGKGMSSLHPGGLNILLCDGAVRFLPETVDRLNVQIPLCQREDGLTFQMP